MRIVRVLGPLLLIVLLAWVIYGVVAAPGVRPEPNVLGIGNAFQGDLHLPLSVVESHFDAARTHMRQVNATGTTLHWLGDAVAWCAFLATAAITLIAGFFGVRPTGTANAPNTDGLPSHVVRTIAFIAAISAVLTAFGNLSTAKSQDYYAKADQIRDVIAKARGQVIDAKNATEAQQVLDNLDLVVSRLS